MEWTGTEASGTRVSPCRARLRESRASFVKLPFKRDDTKASQMPATQEITETLIRENVSRAMTHVFKTMLAKVPAAVFLRDREPGASSPGAVLSLVNSQVHVVGTLGFIGDVTGLVYIYLPLPFARLCTRHLLGMTERELDEAGDDAVNDAIGEFTNITVGNFKSGLCDAGYSCMLTMPSILRGKNLGIEPVTSAPRHVYVFECADHRIVIDILLKVRE